MRIISRQGIIEKGGEIKFTGGDTLVFMPGSEIALFVVVNEGAPEGKTVHFHYPYSTVPNTPTCHSGTAKGWKNLITTDDVTNVTCGNCKRSSTFKYYVGKRKREIAERNLHNDQP